jgi:Zn-dependent M28 family amino/carboxypeptidase
LLKVEQADFLPGTMTRRRIMSVTGCLLAVALAAACTHRPPRESLLVSAAPLPPVNTPAMDAHLKYLADDLLEGRAPATRGGELAARYIAAQFEAIGLLPAGPDNSYYQPVTLIGMTPRASFAWGVAAASEPLRYLDDFVAWAGRPDAHSAAKGDVVFVGYGVRAPEWNWDDYKGLDVRGKVLLMMVNDPGLQDTSVFKGRGLTYYGRWTYKLEEAARRGAAGVVLIHTARSATYPWEVVRSSWSVEQFTLDGPATPQLSFASWVTAGAATRALKAAGLSFDSLTRAAARRDFTPIATRLQVAVTISGATRRVHSANVVATLKGSDPVLADQVVLITAHYDHKGIGPATEGDSIYNGAEDNASGVAAMLAAAQALAQVTPRPKRSLLFIATTAEESGLLGSEAYVRAPIIPLERTAAVLNIDGANVRGATRDIAALGADRSDLGGTFAAAATAESLIATGDPDPTKGSFFRSDHFPFARAGVPCISIESGVDFPGRPTGWGVQQADFFNEQRYHQPSDEYQTTFNYDGMAQQVRVMLRIALALANSSEMPRWLPTSEFQRAARR